MSKKKVVQDFNVTLLISVEVDADDDDNAIALARQKIIDNVEVRINSQGIDLIESDVETNTKQIEESDNLEVQAMLVPVAPNLEHSPDTQLAVLEETQEISIDDLARQVITIA